MTSTTIKTKNTSLTLRIILIVLLVFLVGIVFVRNSYATQAREGDVVAVNYALRLEDGTLFDTNIKEEAAAAGTYDAQRDYQPLVFAIGSNSVIKGFEKAVTGMKKNEQKTVVIPPEEGYGPRDENLVIKNREKTFTRDEYSTVSLADFKQIFKKDPELNEILSTSLSPLKLQVTLADAVNVTLKNIATPGQEIKLSGTTWNTRVVSVENKVITFAQEPNVGDRILINPEQDQVGTVTRVGTTDYDLDMNHALAGKTLTFMVQLVDFKRD